MTKEVLIAKIEAFVSESPLNRIKAENAIYPELAGLQMYETPLVGFSAAEDELYTKTFKQQEVISPKFKAPAEWLPSAKTVISIFLPFTEQVRVSNRTKKDPPYEEGVQPGASAEWLHARIEGQDFINALTDYVQALLKEEGFESFCPTTSGKLEMVEPFKSNWSERHAAYASGLGTFGLSKGLITKKGMAGRIGSVITEAVFKADERPYTEPFEYCIMCGACQSRCPVSAIDKEKGCALGKDQLICGPYVNGSKLPPHGPSGIVRYGCGKCQVAVPCEHQIPKKPQSKALAEDNNSKGGHKMNEYEIALQKRRSCRNYKNDPIPEDVLQRIMETATYAPTGMGKQSPIMIAVTNREVRDKLMKINASILGSDNDPFYGAPVIVIVLANKNVRTYQYDGSLVMGALMNAAYSEGVASCWIHRAKETFETEEGKELLRALGIDPEEYEGIGNCIMGYAKKKAPAARPRKENYIYYIK